MPRIDPERLLKTLAPLLEPTSGAIKSENEVDKIYGLMSKFSKKLVSKCTYLNILKSTRPDVLDLFLKRGGWDMVLGWTQDAISKRNYDLMKEISNFLLYAPATVQRLKENELPKIIKSLSRDCENEEIRELSKQVVMKWISIAKNLEPPMTINYFALGNASDGSTTTVPVQSSSVTSSKCSSGDAEQQHQNDILDISAFDITNAELNSMLDFNPDDFSKAVDQHLGDFSDAVASGNAVVRAIDNANVSVDSSDAVKINLNSALQPIPSAPKLLIKTVGGQAVVQNISVGNATSKQEEPFCIVMKDGKPFLVKLKLASAQEVSKIQNIQQARNEEISSTFSEKKKKKDSPSTSKKSSGDDNKNTIKTYSKKNPLEEISEKSKSSTSEKSKSDSSSKKHRSSQSKSNSSATAAAKKKEEEEKAEKLREKIRQEKLILKKRAKEAAKQKQMDKDQETLKKLNLNREPSVTAPPNNSTTNKIPKLSSKNRSTSFADAIGIPGAMDSTTSVKSLTKKKSSSEDLESKEKEGNNKKEKESSSSSSSTGEKSKERRLHNVKVFQSKKSRADDLLKDMTANVKTNNKSNKSESSSKLGDTGEKSLAGNSLIFKPEKRPSIDGIEKPGDSKKPKMADDSAEKKRIMKEKKTPTPIIALKESSLFMDALTANSEPAIKISSNKRNRRLSSSTKEKDIKSPSSSSKSGNKGSSPIQETQPQSVEAMKPVFNFYRETLDDSETTPKKSSPPTKESTSPPDDDAMEVICDDDAEYNDDEDIQIISDDISANMRGEPEIKGVLVIPTRKGKPKKSVRWRDDEDLVQVEYFELDEDERVNVTKHKDFLAMKEHEKAEEKLFIAKSLMHRGLSDDFEEKFAWRKPPLLAINIEIPENKSEEKFVQEDRERKTLGVFLPPGSIIPDTPSEPDPNFDEERTELKTIPMEDVMNVTKVYDNRHMNWPNPHHSSFGQKVSNPTISPTNASIFGIPTFREIQQQHAQNMAAMGIPQPGIQNGQDFSNPWSNHTPTPTINDMMSGMSGINPIAIPNGPISFPPPNMMNPFGMPPPNVAPQFLPPQGLNFPPPPQGQIQPVNNISSSNNNFGSSNRENTNHRGGGYSSHGSSSSRNSSRDFGDKDLRRSSYSRDSSKDHDSRSRDGYDSRARSRNDNRSRGDRDRRSPSPRSRRRDDRDRHDKDYRDHDYRSGQRQRSGGRKDTLCRYYAKGNCSNNRCEFTHEGDKQRHESSSRSNSSNSSSNNHKKSPQSEDNWEEDPSKLFERRVSSETATTFEDAPSSPNEITDSLLPQTKIIPVE